MMSWDMRPTAMVAGDAAGAGAGDQRRSCFCCGEVGHLARDCLQRVSRKSPGTALTCFACGQPGHFARDCPNKFMRNRTRNRPSRPNRTAGIIRAGGPSAGGGEGGPNRTAGVTRAGVMSASDGGPNLTTRITGSAGTTTVRGEGGPNLMSAGSEGGPNCIAGITGAAGTSAAGGEGDPYRMNHFGGEGGPNSAAGITQAASTSAVGVGVEGGSNGTSGITRAGGMNANGSEGGPNHTTGITRPGYTGVRGGEGGPNCTIGITRAGGTSAGRIADGLWITLADYMSAGGRPEGGPNRTAGITRAGGMGAARGEGRHNPTAGIIQSGGTGAGRGEGVPNCAARITPAGGTGVGRGEGGLNRTVGITRAGGTGVGGGEGGPNRTAGITRAGGMGADRGEGRHNPTAGIIQSGGTGADRGEGGPNCAARITPAGGTGVGRGEGGPNRTVGITRAGGTGVGGGEGGPNHTAGITRARGTGAAGRGLWIRRRELPHTALPATADQSKDSTFIHGGRIGGVSSLNQTSYFPGTLCQEYGGSGYSPDEPVSQSYHNVDWQYDTGRFFGSSGITSGGSSSREYSSLLDISKGDCGEGSSGSSKDSGEASSARGLFLNEISTSSSGNDFDNDDYKDLDLWLSRTLLSEGKIMEKRSGFVAKVSEGIDGERSSNAEYRSGKSFNNNGTTSRGPAVIEISSSEDEEGNVRKKTTGILFPIGKVKEEIKRVVGYDTYYDDYGDDDDDDDDDCVILECNPFEPPTADFEQKVSLSENKSSIVHDEDITVIAERGQVACRDYPHSRHHCAKFPFSKTTHESCCPQCYCYICEVVAPCEYWDGSCGHCHASDLDPIWGVMKKIYRSNMGGYEEDL